MDRAIDQLTEADDFMMINGSTMSTTESYSEHQKQEIRCWYMSHLHVNLSEGVGCPSTWDNVMCWYQTESDTMVKQRCPPPAPEHVYATRYCNASGFWEERTNYDQCLDHLNSLLDTPSPTLEEVIDKDLAIVMRDIYFILSILSLVLLVITFFIFQYFRLHRRAANYTSLHCSRVFIHKNLVISFIIRFIILIVMMEPFVTGNPNSYYKVKWLCRTIMFLNMYAILTNIYWMFVEGLFLHNSIAGAVLRNNAPIKLFLFLGWVFPSFAAIAWAIVMHFENENECWADYSKSPYIYIIIVPFIAALSINIIFLVNIIRILVSKLRANNTAESSRIRKTIKATIILLPLLGLTNLFFFYNPGGKLTKSYHITNAVLQSTQGIMVSFFYCFLSGEVRRVIRQKWYRFKANRHLRNRGRRRSSRATLSYNMSHTEPRNISNDKNAEQVPLTEISRERFSSKGSNHETNNIPYSIPQNFTNKTLSTISTVMNNSYQNLNVSSGTNVNSNESGALMDSVNSTAPLLSKRNSEGYSLVKTSSDDDEKDLNYNHTLHSCNSVPNISSVYQPLIATEAKPVGNSTKKVDFEITTPGEQSPENSSRTLNGALSSLPSSVVGKTQCNELEKDSEIHVVDIASGDGSTRNTKDNQSKTWGDTTVSEKTDSLSELEKSNTESLSDEFLHGIDNDLDLSSDWNEILALCNSVSEMTTQHQSQIVNNQHS